MAPPRRVQLSCPQPDWLIEITDDDSRTLVHVDNEVSYHSRCGAASECDHVYLINGGCSIETGTDTFSGWPSTILEIGFGTGLSMLRTLDRMVRYERPLKFISVERRPLMCETLRLLDLSRGLHQPELAEQFLNWYAEQIEPTFVDRQRDSGSLFSSHWKLSAMHEVELVVGDARDFAAHANVIADTVYLDAFDPKTNPELWEIPFLRMLVQRLRPGGRLVTYCVATEIRHRMEAVGLDVLRVPGPKGGKREVMIATRPSDCDHARG